MTARFSPKERKKRAVIDRALYLDHQCRTVDDVAVGESGRPSAPRSSRPRCSVDRRTPIISCKPEQSTGPSRRARIIARPGPSGAAMDVQFVGMDVSKDKLDVHVRPIDQSETVSYTEGGLSQLVAWMKQVQPQVIVIEATGGYERRLVAILLTNELPVAVINPERVRHFAKAK